MEAWGPRGDPARHRPLASLEAGLGALPAAPRDEGRLLLVVRRRADGVREAPERIVLSREEGVPGDRWSRLPRRDPEQQLSVMCGAVAGLIANGQALAVFGDNLFVDLDLSAANLPAGSRLRVGEAVVEMTPQPHDGCSKFKARFGGDALAFVQARASRSLNLRGVYWKVVEAGPVGAGDPIHLLCRGGSIPARRAEILEPG
jgi:hypothetical protein